MTKKPFTNDYVIRDTLNHMIKRIEISQQKCLSRMAEFEGDSDAVAEVMLTLSNLNRLYKMMSEIKDQNKTLIGEK